MKTVNFMYESPVVRVIELDLITPICGSNDPAQSPADDNQKYQIGSTSSWF